MSYVIQGLFFQDRLELGIEYRPETGAAAVRHRSLGQYMFAGAFWQEGLGLVGFIQDAFGSAAVSNISIAESVIAFRKIYGGRSDAINYRFAKRDGASWVGEYSGILTGNGITRCLLTEVPDSFFAPEAIMALLGKTQPFKPPLDDNFADPPFDR